MLEHWRNEIVDEARVEPTGIVMRRRGLEWFEHVKKETKQKTFEQLWKLTWRGKRPRGRPKLRWNYSVRRDLKGWNIREEWATDRERWKGLQDPQTRTGKRRRKVRNVRKKRTRSPFVLYKK